MSWDYKFTEKSFKQLKKLGQEPSRRIVKFLKTRILPVKNPRQFGKPLKGDLGEFWRYRVDDYRLLCRFENDQLIVIVVEVGHRRDVYD